WARAARSWSAPPRPCRPGSPRSTCTPAGRSGSSRSRPPRTSSTWSRAASSSPAPTGCCCTAGDGGPSGLARQPHRRRHAYLPARPDDEVGVVRGDQQVIVHEQQVLRPDAGRVDLAQPGEPGRLAVHHELPDGAGTSVRYVDATVGGDDRSEEHTSEL